MLKVDGSILACSLVLCTWQHSKACCILLCVVWSAIVCPSCSFYVCHFCFRWMLIHPLARHFWCWTGRSNAEYRRAHFEAEGPQKDVNTIDLHVEFVLNESSDETVVDFLSYFTAGRWEFYSLSSLMWHTFPADCFKTIGPQAMGSDKVRIACDERIACEGGTTLRHWPWFFALKAKTHIYIGFPHPNIT